MAAPITLLPLLDQAKVQHAKAKEGFENTSERRLTYCGIVVVLVTMFLAGIMAWRINDGCSMYQRVIHTVVGFSNGWLYILYVVVGALLGSFNVGCSAKQLNLDEILKL
jgi:glycerol uptake facilitator-like aquaporin